VDAVLNSGKLLSILRRHGFHMILLGHKHDPYVFTEDARSAFRVTHQTPIMVAAGGSFGSTELPDRRDNCYNQISIKWHPAASQARILIETVGLTVIDEDGQEALLSNWTWKILRREDLHFLKGECIPTRSPRAETLQPAPEQLKANDHRRRRVCASPGELALRRSGRRCGRTKVTKRSFGYASIRARNDLRASRGPQVRSSRRSCASTGTWMPDSVRRLTTGGRCSSRRR
jgi:hypothetical protein